MTQLQNRIRAGGFLQSEANAFRSRDHVTIEGGTGGAGRVNAGTVMGQISSTGKYIPWVHSAGDGSQTAIAILWDDVDATSGDIVGAVISREAEVRLADLTYDLTGSVPTMTANLATKGIIVRS